VNITGDSWVGALGGDVSSTENCYSTGTVTGNMRVGGLYGTANAANRCYSSSIVNGNFSVGGLGGGNYSPYTIDCYATGVVSGGSSVGGLIGDNGANIQNCYSTGSVTGTADFGGLIGSGIGGANNSFWDTQTSGQASSAAGIGKTTAEMKLIATYLSDPSLSSPWDFNSANNIWAYNGGYPFLRYETAKTPGFIWLSHSLTETDWATEGNWSENAVPASGKNVYIPKEILLVDPPSFIITAPILGAAGQNVHNLTIESGGKLTIASGGQLTVAGTLTNSAGSTGLVVEALGSLITNGSVVGSATVNCTIPAASAPGAWHFISAPVSNAFSDLFKDLYLQELDETNYLYKDITAIGTAIIPMKGYALWGDVAGLPISYIGNLNNGVTTSIPVTRTNSLPPGQPGWNLVGNPFPSYIDWMSGGWTKTNVNASIYIELNGVWASYNGTIGINGGSRYIAPCQGFLVEASSTGSLTMTNAVRTHNTATFFKNSQEVVNNLIRLKVTGNGYSDEAVVMFLPDATSEFDGQFDAHKRYGDIKEVAQIYTLGSIPLAINTLPETSSVPVGIHVGVNGTFTIAATEMNDLKYVTLEDTKTGIFTDLSVKPYTFNFTAGENEQRFVLHFSALSVNEKESTVANIYSNNQTVYVNMKDQLKGDIFVYDISGKLITSKVSVQGTTEIGLNVTGNYIVKVITKDNTEVKKVFIK
jgi:hypothetical protein